METSGYLGPLAALTSSITWALASTHYASAARAYGTLRVGLLRACWATALWVAVLLVQGAASALSAIQPARAACLVGSIMCSYVIGDRLFFTAAAQIGVPSAMAIATVYPLWAALYGALARAEPLGPLRALGIVTCIAGVSLVLRLSRTSSDGVARAARARLAVALAFVTSVCWAGNAVLLKAGADGIPVAQANALRYSSGLLLLAVQLPFTARVATARVPETPRALLARRVALALVLDVGIGSIAYVYGIANSPLALGATLSSLSPLAALPIAVMLGQERFSGAKLVAIATTLAGVTALVLS